LVLLIPFPTYFFGYFGLFFLLLWWWWHCFPKLAQVVPGWWFWFPFGIIFWPRFLRCSQDKVPPWCFGPFLAKPTFFSKWLIGLVVGLFNSWFLGDREVGLEPKRPFGGQRPPG